MHFNKKNIACVLIKTYSLQSNLKQPGIIQGIQIYTSYYVKNMQEVCMHSCQNNNLFEMVLQDSILPVIMHYLHVPDFLAIQRAQQFAMSE